MDEKEASTNLPEELEQISSPSKDVKESTVASVPNDPSKPCEPTVEPESIEEPSSTPMPAPAAEVTEQAVPEEQESSVSELTESEDNSQETDNKISCDSEPSRTDEPNTVTEPDDFSSAIIQTESEVRTEHVSEKKESEGIVKDTNLEKSADDTKEDLFVTQLTDSVRGIAEDIKEIIDVENLTDNVKEVINDDKDVADNVTEMTENVKDEEDEVNQVTDNLREIIDDVKDETDVKEAMGEVKNQIDPERMVDTETFDEKESAEIDTLESNVPSDISVSVSENDMVASPIVVTEPEMSDINEETSKECLEMEVLSPSKPDKDLSLDDSGKIQENGNDETLDNISSSVVFLTEDKSDDIHDESSKNVCELLSETDEHSLDREISQENPVFVHVNSKSDKSTSNLDSENDSTVGNDGDEGNDISLVEEDPIGVQENSDKSDMEFEENDTVEKEQLKDVFSTETIVSDKPVIVDIEASKDADEELCIIPDTERVISQEEKDAATAAAAATTEKDDDSHAGNQDKDKSALNETESADESTEQLDATTTETDKPTETDDFSNVVEIPNDQAVEIPCHQCGLLKKCVQTVELANEKVYFCTSVCLEAYRELKKSQNKKLEGVITVKDISKTLMDKPVQSPTVPTPNKVFIRRCAECTTPITLEDNKTLSWETMDFCNEDCLSKYQHKIGSHCANCKKVVIMSSLGKYCVRFGYDIRQFCCSLCLEEFKKGLKVCSYCQKDISGGTEGFLAPVGDKGQFKDFCSQLCMERYDHMSNSNPAKPLSLPADVSQCSVCKSEKLIVVLYEQNDKKHKFCSEPCFVAFKFVNHVDPTQCDMCKKYFETLEPTEFSIFYEQVVRNFCCKTCQNIYIIANRRIVPCSWCKVKKYNFDMIKKICNMNQVLMMCSLNCLSLFQVSVSAVSSKRVKCDSCAKTGQAQYHLAMSDSTVRNFCTYHCVMSFQNQYAKLPISLGDKTPIVSSATPVPLGVPRRTYQNRQTRGMSNENNEVGLPVITNVQSLANQTNGPSSSNRTNAVKINNQQNNLHPPPKVQVKQQIIVKKAPIPAMKNAGVLCKPILHTKGVNCRPQMFNKETQTDVIKEKTILVPVPVPIYVPSPLHMFSAPVPVPIPFPLPVPIPIFIPTTRNSSAGIIKEIKKIQVKIPTDPFEAELLMMAEMVAGEKKVDNTDSESDDDDNAASSAADGGFSPEAVDTSNTFGDDVLQMALKMATELDEPAVDLEGALTANTITATQTQDNTEEAVDDPQPMNIHHVIDRQALRGRKRTVRQPRNLNPSKRGRRMNSNVDMPMMPPPQPAQPPEPVEKPDANMCLKYTFGVNAWKQWVTTKNAELEKSSRRVKLFKPEILQLTSDELNYSLCLFVKEVRKPNGTEYAPDTIYYLCLGIQQYLFENGRIDNIFTDAYYEKFTDCLDEVARKFSILYNDSHYIVTRVEEEHLWESKQLGAHSPHVLLSTLMFFNTKHFNLTTVDEHMQLSFSHIMKHWKRNPNQPGATKVAGSRNVLLRFYPPQQALDTNSRKKKVYEQQENEENPLRCPVKLYEFYLSKCPESVKTRNDVFYLLPERSCVPDSPVWYSTMALGRDALEKMLHRVKMVKEINVALLTS